ncbi:DeoR/GlpR transcriptional regulator [Pseudonocardiaceae bacterium YIM PH 21723]|nr:DeoR/GlpR transcriptional regulator [Pseudonocardiaceae bacterium YIM PH 21723]
MESTPRIRVIVDLLQEQGRITVAELAERTGASEMTIRRDLDQLAEQGVLRRVRGGAISLLLRGEATPFAIRERADTTIKDAIAAELDSLISDGETVILDSGTTTLAVARRLARRRVTVVPLDLHAVTVLSRGPEVTLLVPGGRTLPGSLMFTGHLTALSLSALRVDTVILGACGLSVRHGLTSNSLDEVPIRQQAIGAADRRIAVCAGGKFSDAGFGLVCPAADLDMVITDDGAPAAQLAAMAQAGVEVRTVSGI